MHSCAPLKNVSYDFCFDPGLPESVFYFSKLILWNTSIILLTFRLTVMQLENAVCIVPNSLRSVMLESCFLARLLINVDECFMCAWECTPAHYRTLGWRQFCTLFGGGTYAHVCGQKLMLGVFLGCLPPYCFVLRQYSTLSSNSLCSWG